MTLPAHYRSGWTEPYCSFVLLLEKLLGVWGGGVLQWIPIDFSGIELHAAPIANYCFFLVGSPAVGPSTAATSHPRLTFQSKQMTRRMNWGNGSRRDGECERQRWVNANRLAWSEACGCKCFLMRVGGVEGGRRHTINKV